MQKREFRLSAEEAEYLQTLASKDYSLRGLVLLSRRPHGRIVISLDRTQAWTLRDYLTNRMAVVGFAESYSPTAEGRIMEALIDKLFLP